MNDDLISSVFAVRMAVPRLRLLVAALVTIVVHAALYWATVRTEPSLEAWSADLSLAVHEAIARSESIRVRREEPVRSETPPAEAPPTTQAVPVPVAPQRTVAPTRSSSTPSAEPATAAPLLTSDGVVDLSGNTFVTGTASAFAGGATAATGTSTTAVRAEVATPGAVHRSEPSGPSLASSIALDANAWHCAWPSSADVADVFSETVVLRVTVGADGRVLEVSATGDARPELARQAESCARRTTFVPARNRSGQSIDAHALIRVGFVR